jgi:hypothetical protein
MGASPPRVFISYSHDSTQHKDLVLRFAERLRKDGIDAQIDQYVKGRPPGGWPRWMWDKLDWAEFVLLICTETYYRRFRGHEEPSKGKGVDWEGQLITFEIYQAKSRTTKFVPVIFAAQDEEFIPEPLRDHPYRVDSEDSYQELYGFLTGQAGVPLAELGAVKTLPRKEVEPLTFGEPDEKAPLSGKIEGVSERSSHHSPKEDDQLARKPGPTNPLRGGYGFLTDYGCDPKQARGRVATLAQTYGIKDFQFYDWFATYSKPTNGPSWPDPFKGKRQIQLETIRAYIDEIHRYGGRAWASVLAVGAKEKNLLDPSAGIYELRDRDNKHYRHPPDAPEPIFWAYFLNKAWADRMTGVWGPAVKELGFDGIHWNTLGKIAGKEREEAKGTLEFLERAKKKLDELGLSQTLNFVDLAWWDPDLVESGVVAFPYAVVSSRDKRKDYYDAMDNPKLKRAGIWGVMAFYPSEGRTDFEVMLARWAEAPKHRLRYLILGDNEKYLTGPYFPEDANLLSLPEKEKMVERAR